MTEGSRPSQFEDINAVLITEDTTSEHVNKRCGCQSKEDLLPSVIFECCYFLFFLVFFCVFFTFPYICNIRHFK